MTLSKYQVQRGSYVTGLFTDETEAMWADAIDGLSLPAPAATDYDLPGHGLAGGRDHGGSRLWVLPMLVVATATDEMDIDEACEAALDDLKAAYRWVDDDEDELDLVVRYALPERIYYGRPRGVDIIETDLHRGNARVDATFAALDPFGYGASHTQADTSPGPLAIVSGGNAPSKRATLTITGNGGTPVVSTSDGAITFGMALSGTAVLDLATQSMTISGVHHEEMIEAASPWFRVPVGATNITYSGCAGISLTWRECWW